MKVSKREFSQQHKIRKKLKGQKKVCENYLLIFNFFEAYFEMLHFIIEFLFQQGYN